MVVTLVNVLVAFCWLAFLWWWNRKLKRIATKQATANESVENADAPDEPGCCLCSLCFGGVTGVRRVFGLCYNVFVALSCMVGAPCIGIIVFALVARPMGWLEQYEQDFHHLRSHNEL